MENKAAFEVIRESLDCICFRDCDFEWDNCRHREAYEWLRLLLAQIEGVNGNV